jgi:hypothetical protein
MRPVGEVHLIRLAKAFLYRLDASIATVDNLSIALHQHVEALSKNTKATEDATRYQAKQPSAVVGTVAVELKKPISTTIQGETKTLVKTSRDWKDGTRGYSWRLSD